MSDVRDWLHEHGFEQFADLFEENEIDGGVLFDLTNDDLKELGLPLGWRKKLLKAIAGISETQQESITARPISGDFAGERRQVTVLFADIVGYTKLASELGAEETHALLNRYFEVVDGVIQAYGGTIDKHMGDNVMALFGAPVAHDDDPFRAVRAALDIHERMATLSDELARQLNTHIGIASGQVVASGTGSDAHSEYTVIGDTVNLASRLQDKAAPGETLISDNVNRAIAQRVECESLGHITLKGLDVPVRVWRIDTLVSDDQRDPHVAFVGRRAEIGQFTGVVEACRANGTGQMVVVRGEAGIGKTRLVEEFTAIATDQGFANHKGLVLDFGVGKGQDAIQLIVRSLLDIPRGGAKFVRQAAAEAALANGVLDANQRVFLNDLLDLPQPIEERAMYDAMDTETRNDGKRTVVSDLMRGASISAPIVVIVEDIHWAGSLVLAHLAAMASAVADCPALLVTTSRIEGYPLDQAWRAASGNCPLMTLDLTPLHQKEAITFASTFIDVSEQFALDCIERASGNPLFLEQLLRAAETCNDEDVPASIQSLVLARVDRLPPHDKRALQAASVIGQRFTSDALGHLVDDASYDCASLLEHHLVRPEGDSLLFAHALIRDGVYASLLTATRKGLHVRAAQWFADHDLVLRAEHLDQAENSGAPAAYLEAARAQASLYHYERALELVERGRNLAKDAEAEFALTSLHGEYLNDVGMVAESLAAYRQALSLATDDIDRCNSLIGIAAGLRLSNESTHALEVLEEAEPIAVQHDLSLELARLHHLRGNLYFPLGKVDECEEAHRQGLEFARKAGSAEAEARALGAIGDVAYMRGQMATAHRCYSDCATLSQRQGFGRIEVAHLGMAGWTLHFMNELHSGLDTTLGAAELSRTVGDRRAEFIAVFGAVCIMVDLGDVSRAPAFIERGRELIEHLGSSVLEPTIGFLLAYCHEAEGRHRQAIDELKDCIPKARESSASFIAPRILGYFATLTDDPVARRDALKEAEALLQEGSVGHNFLEFYVYAMDACLKSGDWDEVERYALALEEFTRGEPLPASDFFIARGRTLAAHGRGDHDHATVQELKLLREEAARVGLKRALPALEEAIAA